MEEERGAGPEWKRIEEQGQSGRGKRSRARIGRRHKTKSQVLTPVYPQHHRFMQDNDPKHTSRKSLTCHEQACQDHPRARSHHREGCAISRAFHGGLASFWLQSTALGWPFHILSLKVFGKFACSWRVTKLRNSVF